MIRNRLRLLAWGSLAVVILAVLLSLWGYNLMQNEKARDDSISQLRRDAVRATSSNLGQSGYLLGKPP